MIELYSKVTNRGQIICMWMTRDSLERKIIAPLAKGEEQVCPYVVYGDRYMLVCICIMFNINDK